MSRQRVISTETEPTQSAAKTTAATAVFEKLREDILNGSLIPGEKLRIESIAERYSVGVNPVREALNRLSSHGLVNQKDQRGFFVPPLSVDRLRELVKTRCWLEGKAVEESISNRTPAWEEALVLAFYRLSRTPWNDPASTVLKVNPAWEQCHRAFHLALIGNCGSSWLIEFCSTMMDQAVRYRNISVTTTYPHRNTLEEHRLIMEAALDGQSELTVRRLCDHYTLTLDGLVAALSRPNGEAAS